MEIGLAGLTVRAPRWVPLREIDAALAGACRPGSCARCGAGAAADATCCRATGCPARRSSIRGATLALDLHPARGTRDRADLFHFRVRHPAPGDGPAIAAFRRRLAARTRRCARCAPRGRRAGGAPGRRAAAGAGLERADPNGEAARSAGVIRLNWRLVHLPPELAHYVVAHEVAHLAEMNHSPRFWAQVETLYPGHRRGAPRARRLDGGARGLSGCRRRRRQPQATRSRGGSVTPACACSSARSAAPSSVPDRVSRQRPPLAPKWKPPLRRRHPDLAIGHVPVDDQLAAVLALDLEDAVVQRPVDVDVGGRERPVERLADRGQRGVGDGDEFRCRWS